MDYNGLVSFCSEHPNERACQYLEGLDLEDVENHGTADDRVIAVVPMSPGLWYTFGAEGDGLSYVDNSLSIAGTADSVLGYDSEALPTFQQTGSPKYLATFENTGHYGFTNICDLIPIFTDECTEEGWADIMEVQEKSNILVTAFVDHHLKGEALRTELSPEFWLSDSLVTVDIGD